ncbi:dTDP-glucose 4,6-dehydratase [Erythrobacter sp. SD-21]|uniref:dTDP-glucose 4,6-dehydratase n=1 Tax=Erythrobacter sp. SD-21 TaxID=161528 RepID=UPI000153F397|nr:dTDP-glucose 4,6-dehydratase [Erythrobacter sp. SD-21]EDL49312.1 dTDP-glucose 4,6-dehydratase [Erythrobacter sp. SD-21]
MTSTILVTGGAGFIGTNFVHYWQKQYRDDRIIVLDSLTYAGVAANVEELENVHLVRGDIRNTSLVENLLRDHDIDTIVHFAAESHVDRSIEGPDSFIETNIIGTHSLLKASRNVFLSNDGRPHRFHHVSTDEVYGSLEPDEPAFSEESRYRPNSPYSASKAASDHLVRAYHQTYGLQVTTSNCSNNYGPYQFPEKLIPLFLINCLHDRNLPIYGDGMNVRDWLHVDDHCRGIDLVLKRGCIGETYNIGGGVELPNLELIDRLCGVVDDAFATSPELAELFPEAPAARGEPTTSLKIFVDDRAGHDRRYAIDERKARAELGYQPKTDFDAGLRSTLVWYLENESWWRRLLAS